MLCSPKTTILGILTVAAAVIHAGMEYTGGKPIDVTLLLTGISTGIGLILAKDASTHSTPAQVQKAGVESLAKE